MRTLERNRPDLSDFLKAHRERLLPEDVGLPRGNRRRTPGLRREEVAALAGVGLTWYTWLEQGRDIGVSTTFLDNLARVMKLDAAERRHLFILAHGRPPVEPGKTWCVLSPVIWRLMNDLPHPAFVLNLRWDILGFNSAADVLFNFSQSPSDLRNLLWLIFTSPVFYQRLVDWNEQAFLMLSSFRRDYARAMKDIALDELVTGLRRVSSDFNSWWQQHDAHASCSGVRQILVNGKSTPFDHTSLIIDEERHLRLVVYVEQEQM